MFRYKGGPWACVRLSEWVAAERRSAVAQCCQQLTPLIEEYPQRRALLLALAGSERLLLGKTSQADAAHPAALAEVWSLLGAALTRLLVDVGSAGACAGPVVEAVGVGPTRTLAWLAAMPDATTRVVAPEARQAFLATAPVAALLEAPDAAEITALAGVVAVLEAAGIRTLGQARRLSTDALARRFGAAGVAFGALAAGDDLRPFRPHVGESWLGARLVFDPSGDVGQARVALGPLAEKLALTLAQHEPAAGKIALALEGETGARLRVMRRLAHPLGTTQALLAVAERLLAGLLADAGGAPSAESERYVSVRLRLGGLHTATVEQRRLWAGEQLAAGTERVERLAAALRALAGGKHADALLRAEQHEPDAVLPEERYRLTPRSP